ncbi:hypothetical protein Hanom_Chr01g00061451 [Helianthus anomalus]
MFASGSVTQSGSSQPSCISGQQQIESGSGQIQSKLTVNRGQRFSSGQPVRDRL